MYNNVFFNRVWISNWKFKHSSLLKAKLRKCSTVLKNILRPREGSGDTTRSVCGGQGAVQLLGLLSYLVNVMVFPVVTYGCESWTVKKAERRRIDAFEVWCWRRLLRIPWTARRSPVHSEGDQPWDFFGRNDAKAETPVLWPPHAKSARR